MKNSMTRADVLKLGWKKNPRPLCGRAGVYYLSDKQTKEIIYIGQTKNLGSRLSPCNHPVYRRDKHDVYIIFEDDPQERGQMETRFIMMFRPRFNHNIGWQPTIAEQDVDAAYRKIFG